MIILQPRRCKICNNDFVDSNVHRKYCTKECGLIARQKRWLAWDRKKNNRDAGKKYSCFICKKEIIKVLKHIVAYPSKKEPRRTKDGYPSEFAYDEFAYKRMVNSYRDALKQLIKDIKEWNSGE